MASNPTFCGLHGGALTGLICAVSGITFIVFGYNQAIMSTLLTESTFLQTFPDLDLLNVAAGAQTHHRANIQAITVACFNAGCFVGSLFCVFFADMLGRRKTIALGTSIMVAGAIVQSSSFSLGQLIAGRSIIGVGNGINTATIPIYVAEISKTNRRGQFLLLEGGCIALGAMLAYWINFGFSFTQGTSLSWRFPFALQIVPEIVVIGVIMFLPESPRWLVLAARERDALVTIGALNSRSPNDHRVRDDFMEIKSGILNLLSGEGKLFSNKGERNFHRLVLAILVQIAQQISGINSIIYYISFIYVNRWGWSLNMARILGASNVSAYFVFAALVAMLIDRLWGRRFLMLVGSTGMSICMIMLAAVDGSRPDGADVVCTVFTFLFVAFCAFGWLGIGWLYPAEVMPLRIRGPANAIASAANWLFNFMVVMITPIALTRIGYRFWIIWAATNASIVPLIYFLFPETAYRSLEEMDAIFSKSRGWLDVVHIAADEPRRYNRRGELITHTQWHEQEKPVHVSGWGSESPGEDSVTSFAAPARVRGEDLEDQHHRYESGGSSESNNNTGSNSPLSSDGSQRKSKAMGPSGVPLGHGRRLRTSLRDQR